MDKIYTCKKLASQYVTSLLSTYSCDDYFFVEPSAGDGSFLIPLMSASKSVMGLDIDPALPVIVRQDFLTFDFNECGNKQPVFCIGNPPPVWQMLNCCC